MKVNDDRRGTDNAIVHLSLVFSDRPENPNLVENVEILLPVKFPCLQYSVESFLVDTEPYQITSP